MKCPKCGYTSFDYNDACPKCNKDITAEREKMNLAAYAPNPPSLLSSLTGENGESDFDLKIEGSDGVDSMEQEVSLSPEDSQAIEAMEEAFKDSQELEIELDARHDDERVEPPEIAEVREGTPEQDLSELSVEDAEIGLPQDIKAGGEEIALDEALTMEDAETGQPQAEQAAVDEMDLEVDLSGDDSEIGLPQEVKAGGEEVALDEALTIEDAETGQPQAEQAAVDEMELELDLSVDDSEIGLPQDVKAGGEEIALDEALTVEDAETGQPQTEQAAMDDVAPEPEPSASEVHETEKTAIFDPLKVDEESGSFNLDDLSAVEPEESVEADISGEKKEEALLDLEGLDAILEEGVEEVASADKTDSEKDENLSLDLESLELDLDLDTPEDKST